MFNARKNECVLDVLNNGPLFVISIQKWWKSKQLDFAQISTFKKWMICSEYVSVVAIFSHMDFLVLRDFQYEFSIT